MAGAMLARWLDAGIAAEFSVIKPTPLSPALADNPQVQYTATIKAANAQTDCVVLGVKPQMMAQLLPDTVRHFGTTPVYISIAAGLSLAWYAPYLREAALIRAMPNTPVRIGAGVVTLTANKWVNTAQRDLCNMLCAPLGTVCWLDDEAHSNAATALAGSGPAYVYLFLEAMIKAAKAHGVPESQARLLACATVKGAAGMAMRDSKALSELRQNVTSKGGTTQAALEILMRDDALQQLITDAIDAAVRRAGELAN